MRDFDINQQFTDIKAAATSAINSIFPIEGKLRVIKLDGVTVDDKLDPTNYSEQSKVKSQNGTWGVPVYASLSMYDKATGALIDRAPKTRLFMLPKATSRLSYIVGGNEYQVTNQLRLKSGVFTLRKQNGDLKTTVNLSAGKNFDIMFKESTGIFSITKVAGGQANIPLYPLLIHMGISHTDIERAWGEKLASANKSSDPKILPRVVAAFGIKKGDLKEYFDKTKLNSEITQLTLGEKFDKVNGPMLLVSAKKLLDVHLGKKQPEDRDSLEFKEIHSLEDFIKERLEKNKDALAFRVKRSIDSPKRTKIGQIVNPGAFNNVIETFFTQDDKSATPEQTNPLEMISGQYKATIMGSGGIKSQHAITDEMRNIHPTHYGFLDVIATPECYDSQTEVFTRSGWVFWPDVNKDTEFACLINNVLEFNNATALHIGPYNGIMYGAKTRHLDYLVTPNHRMWTKKLARNAEHKKTDQYRFEFAENMHMTNKTLLTIHKPYIGTNKNPKSIKHVTGSNAIKNIDNINIYDWCEFMGWFLSEGSATYNETSSNYRVRITQSEKVNPDCCKKIANLLNRLPFKWSYNEKAEDFIITVKQLTSELHKFGHCHEKYIPEELFHAPIKARELMLASLLDGDGRTYCNRSNSISYPQMVYCTTSKQLAKDVDRLAVGLGYSVTTGIYTDKRSTDYLNTYEVRMLQPRERSVRRFNHTSQQPDYYAKNYEGNVYCATVPGGLLLVRRNGSVGVWLGNSDRIGANLHLPLGVRKDGNELKMKVEDKDKVAHFITAAQAYNSIIAFPGATGPIVEATHQGKTILVSRNKVQFFTPTAEGLFSVSTNLIPFLPSNQGNRAMMATKQLEQAISLKYREAPLVQVAAANTGLSMEKIVGNENAATAPHDGTVSKITDDAMFIDNTKINLYNYFSLNRKSYIHNIPIVKVGDKVKKGQVIADTNYTSGGVLALGINLKAAYVPYKGYNFEDGIIITDSAATKLTSVHIHKKTFDIDENTIVGLGKFTSQYPNALTSENLKKLDDTGVIKKGQIVKMGDAVITGLQRRQVSQDLGVVQRALADRPKDTSVLWTQEDPGVVMDVQRSGKNITVFIKTEEPAKIGDKLSGRVGNKGIITKIIPDHEAPKDKAGNPVEILLNPHGVISRINIGQIYESASGKIAKKLGKPIVVKNFSGEDYLVKTQKLLDDNKMDDKEELFDENGKSIGQVHVGNPYILKLFKQSTGNFSVRQGGPGQAYDINAQPLKAGGEESSKSMDVLTIYSMLSHGARANLREMSALKSNQNDEFWKALKSGQMLPAPKSPFVYDKFLSYLKGAGIDIKKRGSKMTLTPLTDEEVLKNSSGEVGKVAFYRSKDMEPIKDGFFDPVKFGGFKGTRWGHITLKEPQVNPVFETAIKKLTGLGSKYDDLMAGTLHYKSGEFNKEGKGLTGGAAVEQILKNIDVDKELAALIKRAPNVKANQLDDVNKKIRYLKALKDNNMKPHEAYIRRVVPIVPPVYRPLYALPDGSITTSDVNFLYQNLGILNTMNKLPVMNLLQESEKADLRKDINEHLSGVSGLTDVAIKGRPREGFISAIKGGLGGQPKEGFFISKVLSKRQDFVGRGTIIPEPSLGVDQVALPELMAWKLFEPFIIRELSKSGKTPNQAIDEIKTRSELAKRALQIVLKDRHVMLNRAPSLHKFSIMAFKPTITTGTAIKIPPLITKMFNADFDGDEMLGLIPVFINNLVQECMNADYGVTFLEDRRMAARFKEKVPVMKNGDVFMFNLEDFPREPIFKSKIGKNGRIDFHPVADGIKVLSYDDKTQSVEWKDVAYWSKHYDRKIVIVNLLSGKQIITDDDPRAVYGIKSGTLEFARCTPDDAIKHKMLVPKVIKIDTSGDLKSIKVPESTHDARSRKLHKELFLDKDFGYLVGAVVGDGWCSAGQNLCLASITNEIPIKIDNIINTLFQDRTPVRCTVKNNQSYGRSEKHTYTSVELVDLISPMVGHMADNKHLPPFFMSACYDFRLGLFAGLMDTDGSISISNGKSKPQLMSNYSSNSIRLVQEVQLLASSLDIRSRITPSKTPAGKQCWTLSFSNLDIKKWGGKYMVHPEKLSKLQSIEVSEKSSVLSKYDIIPVSSNLADTMRNYIGSPREASMEHKSLYQILHKASKCGSLSRSTAKRLFDFIPMNVVINHPHGKAWLSIIENKGVTWDRVVHIEKTENIETGYDLTVPGYETFMNVDGVILSNTMVTHVPITDEANKEAEKMLPSRNLYQPGTGKLMMTPSQEAQIGLFYLSKTDAGRKRLNAIVGAKFKIETILNKKETASLLTRLSKELTASDFANVLQNLKSEGEKHAFERGFSVGMEDLVGFNKERDKVVKVIQSLANKAKTQPELVNINTKAVQLIDGLLDSRFKNKNNAFYDMIDSGAKGDKSQLRSIIASPMFVSDSKGRVVPTAIKNSYAEGLGISDYWTSMYGARRGMMDRAVQTSLPGAFSKDIMASTIDNVISAIDCGTHKGVSISIDDHDAIDRFTANEQGGIPYNTLIDSGTLSKLKKAGLKKILVRSPLTCMQSRGTCAKCYGLDEAGHIPAVGENIGAKAGQTISEPLVQLIMNSFHTGGAAGTGSDVGGYKRIDQLLKLPEFVAGAATLSSKAGKITKIDKGVGGGFDVYVGDTKFYVVTGRKLKVKVGDEVHAGDPLSDGVIKPQDLVQHKGMQAAQEYIVDELNKAYKGQGVKLHRKVYETVIRSLGNTTKVLNTPSGSGYVAGDVAPYTVVKHYNENLNLPIATEDAVGEKTNRDYGSIKAGTTLTDAQVQALKTTGVNEIHIEKEPIKHVPFLKRVTELPLLRRDWMSALGYRNLAKALVEGAGQSWSSSHENYHPVPAFAFGAAFGKGKDGKY